MKRRRRSPQGLAHSMAACVVLAALLLWLEAQTHSALPPGVHPAPPGGPLTFCILVPRLSRHAPTLTHPGCFLPLESGAGGAAECHHSDQRFTGRVRSRYISHFSGHVPFQMLHNVHSGWETHRG